MNKRGRPPKYTPEEARQAKLEAGRRAGAKWRANNPRNEYHREYDRNRSVENKLYRASKDRARLYNIPHDITPEDIVVPELCPICDVQMVAGSNSAVSPTLDKVHADKGYVKGNIAVMCRLCNSIKGNGTADRHRQIASFMDKF